MSDSEKQRLGEIGYKAYAEYTGGKTWDGKPMPTWAEVVERDRTRGTRVSGAWEAAAAAIAQAAGVALADAA